MALKSKIFPLILEWSLKFICESVFLLIFCIISLLLQISYSPESLRIIFLGVIDMQSNDPVVFEFRYFVYLLRIKSLKLKLLLACVTKYTADGLIL
jgi:hypothetical protein